MKHEFKSLKTIIEEYKVINVPYYQRDYVWGKSGNGRNLYKFLDDIFSQYNENPESNYFIGTLAFCSNDVNDVIDGQQRITSLILILTRLAQLKCSKTIKDKNKKILFPNNTDFIINEEFYLTEEIKKFLGFENHFDSQGYSVDISKTVDRIDTWINVNWNGKTEKWYDNLYDYILDKVCFISLEYSNIGDSLKYFLNINSLSVPLTQIDIFYSILSQSLRISRDTHSIFNIKRKIAKLGGKRGLSKDIEGYKLYDTKIKSDDNIIYIFLNAYYQKDKDIGSLNEVGIGKWMSFYHNDIFKDQLKAKEFVDKFLQYLDDFEFICKLYENYNNELNSKSSIYTSWVLLQYQSFDDLVKMLNEIFRTRHNYTDDLNLYETGTKSIDIKKLEEISIRFNLSVINNYIRSSTRRLDGFINNIKIKSDKVYERSLQDILDDINYDSIFNLNYNDKKNVSNAKIADDSRIIKVIFALQEAFLNHTASGKDINEYIKDILLSDTFSIEHLYSVKEYNDKERLNNWISKKNKFEDDADFDIERFSFENLSLLNRSINSSANDDEIKDKLVKYKQAKKICSAEWEYLILSLVDCSEFYNNDNISSLLLPKRVLKDIDQNTWSLSDNNRAFNTQLLEYAVKNLANK